MSIHSVYDNDDDYYLENKGIVFKAKWFVICMAWYHITLARPLFKWNDEGIARVISRTNNGYARVLSGQTNQTRFKTIPLFSFVNIFYLSMQTVTKNDV